MKLKPVKCKNCRFFIADNVYKSDGLCKKDGRYTREFRVCNLLETDQLRRDAK